LDANEESRPGYPGWRVVVACGIGVFFATQTFLTFAIFLKPLTVAFGWSRQAIASGFGAMTLASALTAPLMGRMLDRFGLHRISWWCLGVVGAGLVSLAWLKPSLAQFYATFAVIGIATAGTSGVAYVRAISTWFESRRGLALAMMLSATAIGSIVVPPLAQSLVTAVGWRGAYAALGGLVLAVGVWPVKAFARERDFGVARDRAAVPGLAAREALGSRIFWTIAAIVFASTLALNGLLVHLSALLTDRGLAPGQAAAVVSAVGGATLLGRVVTGWMLDRLHAPRLLVGLLACAGAGTFLLARADTFGLSVVAALLAGFGTGGELDVVPYLLSRYFGLRALSTLFGVVWAGWGVAGVIGPALMGRAFDATGSYEATLVKLAALTVGAAVLAATLPRPAARAAHAVAA